MNNRKGFTLTELLAGLVIVAILCGMVIYLLRGTFASTMTQTTNASDNLILDAAKSYALETNAFGKNDYACITVQELKAYGYLKNADNDNRIVKVFRNNATKVIEEIEFVNAC